MRALVLWATKDHPNLGVAALAVGAESLLRRAFGDDVDVRFHGMGGADNPMNDGPVNISHAVPLLKQRILKPEAMKEWLRSFDLVLDMRGGDSFTDIYTVKQLMKMTQIGLYARQWGVPLVMGPQTIGPFDTRRGRVLARATLKSATAVMVRDPESARASGALGRAVDVIATDVAFAIPVPERASQHDVLLNASGLLWNPNPHVDHQEYRESLRALISELQERGRTVSLLAHVASGANSASRGADNDLNAVEALAAEFGGDVVVPEGLEDVRRMVASARVVIGARMHACLNALSVGTPAIAMAYSRKFGPLLSPLGWDRTVDLRRGGSISDRVLSSMEDGAALEIEAAAVRDRADSLMELAVVGIRRALSE